MENQKLIRLLYFWSDLYNFTTGLVLALHSLGTARESGLWMLMFSGLAFSIISLAPTLYSLTRREEEDYQVRWKYKYKCVSILNFDSDIRQTLQ